MLPSSILREILYRYDVPRRKAVTMTLWRTTYVSFCTDPIRHTILRKRRFSSSSSKASDRLFGEKCCRSNESITARNKARIRLLYRTVLIPVPRYRARVASIPYTRNRYSSGTWYIPSGSTKVVTPQFSPQYVLETLLVLVLVLYNYQLPALVTGCPFCSRSIRTHLLYPLLPLAHKTGRQIVPSLSPTPPPVCDAISLLNNASEFSYIIL